MRFVIREMDARAPWRYALLTATLGSPACTIACMVAIDTCTPMEAVETLVLTPAVWGWTILLATIAAAGSGKRHSAVPVDSCSAESRTRTQPFRSLTGLDVGY